MGVLVIRALLCGVYLGAPNVWKLPASSLCSFQPSLIVSSTPDLQVRCAGAQWDEASAWTPMLMACPGSFGGGTKFGELCTSKAAVQSAIKLLSLSLVSGVSYRGLVPTQREPTQTSRDY